ncbi:TIGR03619 family F420-dependent LLM class oxidoreductase [Streptomyces sp. NPDC092296]|uniref:TIGR03619 family F420-dependent LLM class oxidoreductase n=1 Tax=Streptomyces sp. NPDC092296 TaxID=3366012 RepID=UPI0037F495E2
MKFGVNVPNYGGDASPRTLALWAERLEDLGYHHLMLSDHVAITPEVQQLFPAPFYDPFTALAWLAGTTRHIGLGTTVAILPYRHPVHLARVIANIDQLSGGRFVFGAAAGWAPREFAVMNASYRRRGEVSDEYLEVIRACWSGSTASYDGRHVSFRQVATEPLPVRRADGRTAPPVWVGGHSAGAMRRAVRLGDAWHPTSVTGGWLTGVGLPTLKRIAEEHGRPVPALCPRIKLRITDGDMGRYRVLGEGSLDQIRHDLELLERLGAQSVVLDPTYPGEARGRARTDADLKALEILSERVVDLEQQSLR